MSSALQCGMSMDFWYGVDFSVNYAKPVNHTCLMIRHPVQSLSNILCWLTHTRMTMQPKLTSMVSGIIHTCWKVGGDDLVPRNKFLEKCMAVQCVHGDEVSYPLAKVEVVVDGRSYLVEAAVVKKLPKSVLLGRDVPELVRIGNPEEALAAMTRAQAKRKREVEESALEKEKDSGVNCRSLTPVPETVKEKLLPGPVGPKDEGLESSTVIEPGQPEDTNPPKDGAVEIIVNDRDLGVDEKDLRELQLEDETLGAVRESALATIESWELLVLQRRRSSLSSLAPKRGRRGVRH